MRKKKIFHTRIQHKIFIWYLSMMVVMTVIILMLFVFLVNREQEKLTMNQMVMTDRLSSQLEMSLSNMDRVALQVLGSADIIECFEQISEQYDGNYFDSHIYERRELQNTLLNINGPKFVVGRICVYNEQGDYLSYGKYNERSENVKKDNVERRYAQIIDKMNEEGLKRYFLIEGDYWENQTTQILSVFRPLKNAVTGRVSGLIEVQTHVEEFFSFADIEEQEAYQVFIYDKDGRFMYSNSSGYSEKLMHYYRDLSLQTESGTYDNRKNPISQRQEGITVSAADDYKWKVVVIQPNGKLLTGMSNFLIAVLVMIILVVLGTVILIFIISRKLTEPLVQLVESLKEVKMSNLSVVLDEEGEVDIVQKLNEAFSNMFRHLNQSIENEAKVNLRALQAQMNPHFLYNVLSVINATAFEEGSETVPVLCDKLSDMLRYSSSYQDRVVPLSSEIFYARNYCDLMKSRYEDLMEYKIQEQGDTQQVMVPKLMIQPLIENCFKHGFEHSEYQWHIEIEVCVTNEEWRITVSDNGQGFTQEQIREMKEIIDRWEEDPEKQQEASGLGLRNTILRLYLFYKEDFIYDIRNRQTGGAEIVIGGKRHA
ncbi:cache domain-containing sensor histidine kinase [Diplocloster hominis]|uniref:cache domain-containing sensor histidine kinase n=1 Tax=Diplocloster hominis TaxID=3079010 RepID=UPI0031BA3EB8